MSDRVYTWAVLLFVGAAYVLLSGCATKSEPVAYDRQFCDAVSAHRGPGDAITLHCGGWSLKPFRNKVSPYGLAQVK